MLEGPEPTVVPSFQRAQGREHCFVADLWSLVAVSMRAGPPWRGLELVGLWASVVVLMRAGPPWRGLELVGLWASVRASPSQSVWLRGDLLSCP